MNEIIEAEVISNQEIVKDIFRIELQCDTSIPDGKPGQFINLYLRDKSMLLPRPISICRMENEKIILVYRVVGKGTKELSSYREGAFLRISSPLGNGYDLDTVFRTLDQAGPREKTIGIVAGGLGIPPMVELANAIRARLKNGSRSQTDSVECSEGTKTKLIAMLGFQEEPFLTEELNRFCDEVHIAAEKGSAGFRGNVLEMMKNREICADYYLSCGPRPMLKALSGICGRSKKPLQVSLEERMGCGYGACVGCTCKIKESSETGGENSGKTRPQKVCKDGPVFFGSEVIWDE